MSKSIQALEGVGPVYGKKLSECGCGSAAALLEHCATRSGRARLAKRSGLSGSLILRCVNMADLFRIKGVATQYAELLEAAGVDSVKELRHRKPANLAEKMREVNARRKLVRLVPGEKTVAGWVEQARALTPIVSY